MKIAIVDDVREEAKALSAFLHEYETEKQVRLDLDCYYSAEEILSIFSPGRFDLIFMDIYMSGMSGLEAAEKLRAADDNALLIFLTASHEHMPEAFHLHVYDYIQKPAERGTIFRLLDEVHEKLSKQPNLPLFSFISNRSEYNLPLSEIVSVASSANYLEITSRRGITYKTRMTFSAAADCLTADPRFLQINRGILINMDYVARITSNTCRMQNDQYFPLNVKNGKKLEQAWLNYTIDRIRHEPMERGFH